jgi:pyridoxamine 5'-phosphate oxidase
VDNGGLVFYTNYESDKAKDMADFPVATMCFLWLELERQVRISGPVHKVTRARVRTIFLLFTSGESDRRMGITAK